MLRMRGWVSRSHVATWIKLPVPADIALMPPITAYEKPLDWSTLEEPPSLSFREADVRSTISM